MLKLFATDTLSRIYPKIKKFVEEELYPIDLDIITMSEEQRKPIIDGLRQKVKNLGLFTPQLHKEDGGFGLSNCEFGQISELLGTSPMGHLVFNCQAPDAGNMELLSMFVTDTIKERFLQPLVNGEIRSCFGMTEPNNAGSNPVIMSTTAVRDGDEYVINGHKWFTSSADGASFCIVMAVTNQVASSPYRRASMIIVPTDTPGYEMVRNIPVMGEAGEGYYSHAEIKFNNCRVSVDNLIGYEGSGFSLAQERLGPGRIHHCMRWIGICERVFDMMCKRAATRKLGEDMYLGDKQIIQAWIAESRANINASRLMVLHAADQMDKHGAKEAREEISTIKFFVANVMLTILDRAIQVHGALGVTDDTLLSFWYRHERGARIYDGADEVHKTVIARGVLRKYGLDIRRKKQLA